MGKILVVDDDRVLGEMLQLMLRQEGHEVTFLKNPQLTLAYLVHEGSGLVLLDKLMLQLDGCDVCRRIKADDRTADIPVLMMSGLEESRATCMDAGAAGFLSKPFERSELLTKVGEIFG